MDCSGSIESVGNERVNDSGYDMKLSVGLGLKCMVGFLHLFVLSFFFFFFFV